MARRRLEKILEPCCIGKLKVKNRMIHMGSHGSIPKDDQGDAPISPRWLAFYESLAAGGFGLVSLGGGIVKLDETGERGFTTIQSNFSFEGLQALAAVIHKHDAHAFWQLLCGYPTRQLDQAHVTSYASSTLTQDDLDGLIPYYNPTTALTREQIDVITTAFADAAELLQRAGFDGVEINAGHNHGLNTFLSPAWNRRTDEYGGSAENRARIVCEINRKIKERCGADFPIIDNLSGAEYNVEGGRTVADTVELARLFEASGADAIHCRYEMYHEGIPELGIPRTAHELPDVDLYPGYVDEDLSEWGIDNSFGKGMMAWSGAAAAVKAAVSIPVSVSGRTDAFNGDKLIAEGKIDFISICRRAHADADYCRKVAEGAWDDIRPCVGCNTCYDMSAHNVNTWCMVNGGVMEGADYAQVPPADASKRVVVIGSGAAGLEAARVAALRGHDVTIVEREGQLGGTLPLAGMICDFHEDFLGFSRWQVRQVEKLGVRVMTKTVADRALVESLAPDAVIVAVGGAEPAVDIPGIDRKIVVTGEELHRQLRAALKVFNVERLGRLSKLYLPVGRRVVILGGSMHGLRTAHFLMRRGREVVIVEEGPELGAGMLDCGPKPNMLRWLVANDVEMLTNARVREITDAGVVVAGADGAERLIRADSVVTALPLEPNLALYDELAGVAPEVYAVGDCNPLIVDAPYPPSKIEPVESELIWPRFTAAAVREAYRVARGI